MKIYVVDIDGTICTNTFGEYEKAIPIDTRIKYVNSLYEEGNIIKFFTARGSTTSKDWREITEAQLEKWGVKYHELILGKPEGDIFIDDKAFNVLSWNWSINKNSSKCFGDSFIKLNNFMLETQNAMNLAFSSIEIKTKINEVGLKMQEALLRGGKIIFAGNGGSFSDSQHLSAELISKLNIDRKPLSSIALGTNTSTFSAIGNDYGFKNVFSRELAALGKEEDILIALTTSGNSENILALIETAISKNINFFVLTGQDGGKCNKYSNNLIKVPSKNTAIIQQIHIVFGHLLCDLAQAPFI